MSVDPNAPNIEVGIDTKRVEEGIKTIDQSFDTAVQSMNAKLADFENNLQNVFTKLQKLQGNVGALSNAASSSSSAGSPNPQERNTNEHKEERVAKDRQEEDARKKQLEYERLRLEQGKEQIKQGRESIAAIKDMGVSVARVVTGGMGLAAMFDFTHQTARLETFLKSIHVNPVQGMIWKNTLNNKSIEDGEVWQMLSNVANTNRDLQWNNPKFWNSQQGHAYSVLSTFDPNLTAVRDKQGDRITPEQRALMLKNAIRQLQTDQSRQYTDEQKIDIATNALGGSRNIATLFLNGEIDSKAFQKGSPEWKKSSDYVKTFPQLKKTDAAVQDLKNSFSVNMAKAIANITPVAVEFMKSLDGFVSKNGEIVATGAALVTIAATFKGLSGTLRFILGGTTAVAGGSFLKRYGGVIKDGTKAGLKGGKGNLVATGAMIGGAIAYDIATDTPQNNEREAKLRAISEIIKGEVDYNWISGKYNAIGAHRYYNIASDDVDQLSVQDIVKKYNIQPEKHGRYYNYNPLHWIFPEAHAETISNNPSGQGARNRSYSGDKLGVARQIYTAYKEAGFDDHHAETAITNMMRESLGNPNAVGDRGNAYGLWQWQKPRQRDFERVIGHPIQQSTVAEQIRFHLWELQHSPDYKRAGEAFKNATNYHDANRIFVEQYEKPANPEADIIKNNQYLPFARQAMQQPTFEPSWQQMQLEQKTRQIVNQNKRYQGGDQTNHVTVNVASGDPHQIADIVSQKIQQFKRKESELDFPKMNELGGITGGI